MQQHGSKLFAADPPTLGMGSIGQHSLFSEHGHGAYHFKGNLKMQQYGSKYFFPQAPSPTTIGYGVKR